MSALLPASSLTYARKYPKRRWASRMAVGKTQGGEGMELLARAGQPDLNNIAARNAYHNARGPGTAGYTVNPDLWCAEIRELLSCLVVTKDRVFGGGPAGSVWGQRTGGIAITKRHIMYAGHAGDLAAGTWSLAPNAQTPVRLRFIDVNGDTVDRVQIHQANANNTGTLHVGTGFGPNLHIGNDFGATNRDLTIAVLDEDLPDTVLIPWLPPCNRRNEFADYETMVLNQEWMSGNTWGYSLFGISGSFGTIVYRARNPKELGDGITVTQVIEAGRVQIAVEVAGLAITVRLGPAHTNQQVANAVSANASATALVLVRNVYDLTPATPAGAGTGTMLYVNNTNYQSLPFSMLHVKESNYTTFFTSRTARGFTYSVYTGDSGSPRVFMYRGKLFSMGVISGDGPHSYPRTNGETFADRVNLLIQAADSFAVLMGRMTEPTGYTVRVAHDWLWDAPLVTALGKVITLDDGSTVPIFNHIPA